MERIIKGICEAHGASYTFNYDNGYDMVINNEELTQRVEETILEVWGPETLQKMEPMMGSEDFSAFANAAPGCFVVVGVGNSIRLRIRPIFTGTDYAIPYDSRRYRSSHCEFCIYFWGGRRMSS